MPHSAASKILLIGSWLSLTLAQVANAQQPGQFLVPANSQCGDFLAMRARNDGGSIRDASAITGWVSGYLSHYNDVLDRGGVTVPQTGAVLAYMDKYCRENPLGHVVMGTRQLLVELGGKSPR